MNKKHILSILLLFLTVGTLVGCSGMSRAATKPGDEGYTLEENQDLLDGIDDDELDYIKTGYIIYDEQGTIAGSIIEFNSRRDLKSYVETYGTQEELEKLKDNFYRELFIIADDEIINIIKD